MAPFSPSAVRVVKVGIALLVLAALLGGGGCILNYLHDQFSAARTANGRGDARSPSASSPAEPSGCVPTPPPVTVQVPLCGGCGCR